MVLGMTIYVIIVMNQVYDFICNIASFVHIPNIMTNQNIIFNEIEHNAFSIGNLMYY